MLSVIYAECHIQALYAECHIQALCAECNYAEFCYAECHYAECRGAVFVPTKPIQLNLIFASKAIAIQIRATYTIKLQG